MNKQGQEGTFCMSPEKQPGCRAALYMCFHTLNIRMCWTSPVLWKLVWFAPPQFSGRIRPGIGRAAGWSKVPGMSAPPVGLTVNKGCQSLTRRMTNPCWKHQRTFQALSFCSCRKTVVGVVYICWLGPNFLETLIKACTCHHINLKLSLIFSHRFRVKQPPTSFVSSLLQHQRALCQAKQQGGVQNKPKIITEESSCEAPSREHAM